MTVSIIAIALVLGGLIFFHELGHFLVARSFGIGVSTFSLGFGPRLAGFKKGATDYRLSAVPLGGYVHLVGESPEAELPPGFTRQESFSLRPPWQRMLVVAAGPVFNFVLAWLIYAGIFLAMGQQIVLPRIGEVVEDSPAMEAGLEPGDTIVSINGQEVDSWSDMAEMIQDNPDTTLTLVVRGEGGERRVGVTPEIRSSQNIFGEEVKAPMLGISASGDTRSEALGPVQAVTAAGGQTWEIIVLTGQGLVKLVERIIPLDNIGGPIMIAQMVSQQAEQGVVNVLALAALISINLGLLNLLPIPVLDGGHLLFFAVETVMGRPLDRRWQQITIRLGLAFLLTIMALAVFNDLQRIFNG